MRGKIEAIKVENIRTGIYHLVEKRLGNNKFRTLCGLTVEAAEGVITGKERWIQESDAWICNCNSCNRIQRNRRLSTC